MSAYAPTVIFENGLYRMWYTYAEPTGTMVIGHATSVDGIAWEASPANPVLRATEPWEHRHALYPFVLERKSNYEMYYTTFGRICEIAVAQSVDGVRWRKSNGPILSPEANSGYDSIYCSRACVVPERSGRDKLYYASRVDMQHKYYAIALAEKIG